MDDEAGHALELADVEDEAVVAVDERGGGHNHVKWTDPTAVGLHANPQSSEGFGDGQVER